MGSWKRVKIMRVCNECSKEMDSRRMANKHKLSTGHKMNVKKVPVDLVEGIMINTKKTQRKYLC